jgi:hypothetical protein
MAEKCMKRRQKACLLPKQNVNGRNETAIEGQPINMKSVWLHGNKNMDHHPTKS